MKFPLMTVYFERWRLYEALGTWIAVYGGNIGEMKMKHVLIVDDEEQLLLTMQAGFESYNDRFQILTARNGKEATALLASTRINLVVTDLKMPEMDGIELLSFLKNNFPEIPAIVMTAFGTPEIENGLLHTNMIRMLEKPVDFDELTQLILSLLEHDLTGGTLTGISVPSFLQLIEMEQNTCLMEVKSAGYEQGLLYFNKGVLYDAVFGKETGEEAVYSILMLDDVKISFRTLPSKKLKKKIKTPLMKLLMEGIRLKDERALLQEEEKSGNPELEISEPEPSGPDCEAAGIDESTPMKGDNQMANIQEVLEKFKVVDGFEAVGAFSANGEMVAECNVNGTNLAELGALANDVLLKAQKTTEIMKVGRGQLVHVEAPKAHVICRCLNEATDFAANASGRAHVHMVLILNKDGNVAMGKMKISSVIQEVAEFFR
jgi:CheY-like chemotaxis protein/predicted regulator of Ras-like GTPase activity (Roadblock/LC7/MglB family)